MPEARFRARSYNVPTPIPAARDALEDHVELSTRTIADVVVAAPVGQIDHPRAQELQQQLAPTITAAAANRMPLVLDFAGVEYISSMGLRILMMAAKEMRAANTRVAVAALQPVVEEIFEIARFRHVLEVFPSLRAALQAISSSAVAAYDAGAR